MSSVPDTQARPLTFRRYKDGDYEWKDLHQKIFNADHSHKCPTYIQSTPPCQGSGPSGYRMLSSWPLPSSSTRSPGRAIVKPPVGADGKPAMPWQEYAWRRLTEANPFPSIMGRVCPAPCQQGCNRNQVEDFEPVGEWCEEHGVVYPPVKGEGIEE